MKPDDLHVDQWIAVIKCLDEQEEEVQYATTFSPFYHIMGNKPTMPSIDVDGKPLQIKAISLPFVCVSDGQQRFAIDVRRYVFTKLDKHYVKMLSGKGSSNAEVVDQWCVEDKQAEREPEADRSCPLCGNRLIERLDNQEVEWFWLCKQCGFHGNVAGLGGPVGGE